MYSQSVLSLRNVMVKVEDRFGQKDPTVDTVQMAFMQAGAEPQSGDWKTASWFTDSSNPAKPVYYAVCLVGPGGTITLAKGTYLLWLKFADAPEVPADPVAPIIIT